MWLEELKELSISWSCGICLNIKYDFLRSIAVKWKLEEETKLEENVLCRKGKCDAVPSIQNAEELERIKLIKTNFLAILLKGLWLYFLAQLGMKKVRKTTSILL